MNMLKNIICVITNLVALLLIFYCITEHFFTSPELYRQIREYYPFDSRDLLRIVFVLYTLIIFGVHILVFYILMIFKKQSIRVFYIGIIGLAYFLMRVVLVNYLGFIYFPIAVIELYYLKNLMQFIESGRFKFVLKGTK